MNTFVKNFFRMNIHEYQAKNLLKSYGVQVQQGIVADTPEGAVDAARELNAETGTQWYVIKAQIHAGGRGKGVFDTKFKGGVKICR